MVIKVIMDNKLTVDDGLDLDQFWALDQQAHENNCFNDGTKVALGIRMCDECVFDELGITVSHPWDHHDPKDMQNWRRLYNDRAEQIVGRRLLPEAIKPADAVFPEIKRIGEVFGGKYTWQNYTEWLEKGAASYKELEAVLERVETLDYREFMLPPGWEREKQRIFDTYGLKPQTLRHVRGPVTLACSIFGDEDLIYLILDEPDLARRFSAAITHAILEMAKVMDEEAGVTPVTWPGFSFADDCCCLMNPEMYELFGYPVLKAVFDHYSPLPGQGRFQHSDSDMGHLLQILGRLNLTGVNFGPNVLTPEIRRYLPQARIVGCIAPFAFSRNDRAELLRQTRRDCLDGMKYGGVEIATAGSINYGSSLHSLRYIMSLIQEYGRG